MNETLSPHELQNMLTANTATVCDVRRRADYEADPRTIPGAAWHDPEQLEVWAAQLPKDKPVAIYCARGGSVSKAVQAALEQKGLAVQYLEGGLAAWDAAGS